MAGPLKKKLRLPLLTTGPVRAEALPLIVERFFSIFPYITDNKTSAWLRLSAGLTEQPFNVKTMWLPPVRYMDEKCNIFPWWSCGSLRDTLLYRDKSYFLYISTNERHKRVFTLTAMAFFSGHGNARDPHWTITVLSVLCVIQCSKFDNLNKIKFF